MFHKVKIMFCLMIAVLVCSCKNNTKLLDQVLFSPSEQCESLIIKLIKQSQQIDVVIYSLNNENIVLALKKRMMMVKKYVF